MVEYLSSLKEAGLKESDMAVITPYNLQIEFIRTEMKGQFKEVCHKDTVCFESLNLDDVAIKNAIYSYALMSRQRSVRKISSGETISLFSSNWK